MRKRNALFAAAASIGLIIVLSTFLIQPAAGASYTWDGGGSDGTCGGSPGDGNKWSCALNWSSNIVPGPLDNAVFNNTSTKDAVIDSGFGGTITNLSVNSGYTGTITQQRSLSVANLNIFSGIFNASSHGISTTSTFSVNSGTFNGSSGDLTVGNSLSVLNGTYNAPTGTTDVALNMTLSGGSYTSSGGIVEVGQTLSISGTANVNFGNHTAVYLDYTGLGFNMASGSPTFTAPSATMSVFGHFTKTAGTFNHNNGTVAFTTATSRDITCTGDFFNVATFNNLGGYTILSGCTVRLGNNPTATGGLVLDGGVITGTGTFTADDLSFYSGGNGITGFSSLIVEGTFSTNGGTANLSSMTSATFNGGFFAQSGAFTAPTNGTIYFNGPFAQFNGGSYSESNTSYVFDNGIGENTEVSGFGLSDVTFSHEGTVDYTTNYFVVGANPVSTGSLVLRNINTFGSGTFTINGDLTFFGAPNVSQFSAITVNGDFSATQGSPDLTGTTLDVDGDFTVTHGNLTLPASTTIGGDVYLGPGSGSLNHANNGTVTLDGVAQTIFGPDVMTDYEDKFTFYNLTKTVSSADTLSIAVPGEVVVEGTLTLQGASGNLLTLASDTPGTRAYLRTLGSETLSHLNVQDIQQTYYYEIEASGGTVTDLGNNAGWDFTGTTQATPENIYVLANYDDEIYLVDTVDGTLLDTQTVTLAGKTVLWHNGMVRHPVTCTPYALITIDGQTGRSLVTLDPSTGVATEIGDTGKLFGGIAFAPDGTLYGITGVGEADQPESLYLLDPSDASSTYLTDLADGDGSDTLVYNYDTNHLLHMTGLPDPDLGSLNVRQINRETYATTPVAFSGIAHNNDYIYAAFYNQAEQTYMLSQYQYMVRVTDDVGLSYTRTNQNWSGKGIIGENCEANQIVNLSPALSAADLATGLEVNSPNTAYSRPGRTIRLTDSSRLLADIPTDLTDDRDWSSISAGISISQGKSFAHNVTTAPGTGSSYSLYIPIPGGTSSSSVVICPDATNLTEVTTDCSNGVTFMDGQTQSVSGDSVTVTKISYQGNEYWRAEGVTGTGGISLFDDYALKDTLTRLQVSTASDHAIQFGSVNNTNTSGDTIIVDFDDAWDSSAITLSDVDLEDDGVDKTLAAAPGADIWGLSINTSTSTFTFTAPTSGTDYIAASSNLDLKIGTNADGGTNQMVNPATVNSYEISIIITNSSGTETGEIEVPVIDDDTVNVSGYIDTFISFDIDTSDTDEDCDAAGGTSPCNSHGGANDSSGYVIDLGEMNTSSVNDSGDTVVHADGLSGAINYVFFDLSTNADGGAIVTVRSLNGALDGPGSSQIPSVASGSEVQITSGSSLYGINSFGGLVNTAVTGASTIHADCDGTGGNDYYCDVPTVAGEIFNTSGNPIDSLRIQWEIGASPGAQNATGTYTDELTFIATATFLDPFHKSLLLFSYN
ncbi:MAG: hypothetical protein TR69_WS6001000447 [candidate division WS6 bacterium OLB20]|uniref:Uncharacterized protein n=1 Tax=candidate division WS6 bacterium OLB20 TaxID=1617426 RepID=A0A136LXQ3_9BACT|nr:MAG: hypothetical protein TR69_WS6001000447 [candidate division WS6 bacterium OLB20]